MFSFAMDESGNFEERGDISEPIFVAGLLYDDHGDHNEAQSERYRILHYLRKVCEDAGAAFPEDLHLDHEWTNKENVKLVKNRIAASFQEFIKAGTYHGELISGFSSVQPRQGEYYVFAELRSAHGVRSRNQSGQGNITADDYASNLYLHMTTNAVNRVLLHNPWIEKIDSAALYFPTRTLQEKILRNRKEYEGLYEEPDNGFYPIVSADFYRTEIERELSRIGRLDFHIASMLTAPITYHDKGSEAQQNPYAFMYLADFICTRIRFCMQGDGPAAWIESMQTWCAEHFGEDHSIVFGYDDLDEAYGRALEACRIGDIYTALNATWEAKTDPGEFAPLYNRFWFARLTQRIQAWKEPAEISEAVRKLDADLMRSNINQHRVAFLFSSLEAAVKGVEQKGRAADMMRYSFANTGIAVCNHLGDYRSAESYYKTCMTLTGWQSIDTILQTRNRICVAYMDGFNFEEARQTARSSLDAALAVSNARRSLVGPADGDLTYPKTLSQYAQTMACLRDREAAAAFEKAMSLMEKGSANYNITLSYYLHFLLDMGLFDEYQAHAAVYFGGEEDPSSQFQWILSQAVSGGSAYTMKFALYVYVRALWLFQWEKVDGDTRVQVLDLPNVLREKGLGEQLVGHPWEIIYKYLALIAQWEGNAALGKHYIEESMLPHEEKEAAIEAVIYNGLLEYADYTGDTPLKKKARNYLWKKKRDQQRFTFMYH